MTLERFACETCRNLEEQRRLADPGIASDEHCRASDDSATDGSVELGQPAWQPFRQRSLGFEPYELNHPASSLEVVLR